MLEDLSAIQSRIADIQERLAALSAPPPAAPTAADAPAFGQALQQAMAPPVPNSGGAGQEAATSGVYVPPASLGPLPPGGSAPLPVTPGEIVPLPHTSAGALTRSFRLTPQKMACRPRS